MRTAIIRGFEDHFLQTFIPKLIEQYQLDKVYWITHFLQNIPTELKDKIEIVDVAYLNFFKDVDMNDFAPLEESLIDAMKNTESQVMAMNARLNHYHIFYEMNRKRYLRTLRYWNHLLGTTDVQLVLFDILPHSPFDYPLYELCQIHQKPFLFFDNFAPGFTALWKKWDGQPLGLKEKIRELYQKAEENGGIEIDVKLLSKRSQRIWKKQMGINDDEAVPFYMRKEFVQRMKKEYREMQQKRRKAKLKKNLKNLPSYLSWRGLFDFVNYFGKKLLVNQIKKRHLKSRLRHLSQDEIPDQQKFIYIALHLQPEVSTGPRAGAYVDQHLMVEMLSALVPDDVLLLVKENPKQTALYRDADYYDDLVRLRNVRLMSKGVNTYDLINNALAVVTATGTAGWEALFRETPAIIFGHPFYGLCKGVYQVKSKEDCEKALNRILAGQSKPRLADTFLFLQALEQSTIEANLSDLRQLVFPFPEPASVNHLLKALEATQKPVVPLKT